VPGVVPSARNAVLGGTLAAAVAIGLTWPRPRHDPDPAPAPLTVATFNIELFPKSDDQIEGAFDEIAGLGADAIAVQEILDPGVFAEAANRRLGPSWHFVSVETMPPRSRFRVHVGVLYDGDALSLVSEEVHEETRLGGRHKPTLEVRLQPKAGGDVVQIFVVHFKSGADGREVRHEQLDALGDLLIEARRAHPGERAIVMGDFNATEDGDRADLARLAERTGLDWATEELACSAFWRRDDGCFTSRLDHVLTWAPPAEVTAHGACADGCEVRDRCPVYSDEVSDHCPVTASW
jgi:endonuclease/exonuclease/phosphatase family metal-dependent hydrolase